MIIGLTVLGLLYYQLDLGSPDGVDFEKVLPSVINDYTRGYFGVGINRVTGCVHGYFFGY